MRPIIKVDLSATVPEHTINQTATSNTFSHGHSPRLTIKLILRDGGKTPVIEATRLQADVDWEPNVVLVVVPKRISTFIGVRGHLHYSQSPCFKTHHSRVRVLAQSSSEHESGDPAACNDIIEDTISEVG